MNATPPPDLRLPSIEGLRAFEAVARLGSVERAAEELAVTASAVSKRLSTLEDLLGLPLFTRGARLALTAAGREYRPQVAQALALLAAMPQHRRAQQRRRRLRVCAPPTFARQVLVPPLAGYVEAHPEVELELVLSVPFLQAQPPDAEVEVRHGSDPAGRVLMDDVTLPLAAPALLQRGLPLHGPASLAAWPLLRSPIEPWAPWFRAAGLALPEPDAGPRFVDLGLALEAAVAGQGVVLGRPSLARAWLRSGALRPVFGAGSTLARPEAAYRLMPVADDEAAAGFAAWLERVAADAAAEGLAWISGAA